MSAPDSSSGSSPTATPWVVGIFGTLLLYLLSPGLFVLCHKTGLNTPKWLEAALVPIAWACQEFPAVAHLYELYMRALGAPV